MEVFPKQGMGKQAAFPGKKPSPFPIVLKGPALPPLTARAESQQRAALGVAEGRVEPKPGTTVSRVLPCTLLFPSCMCSVPAAGEDAEQHVPAAPWDRHARDSEGQSPCGHARAALCLHRIHFGQRFPGSQLFIPTLGKEGMRETEMEPGRQETKLP